MADTIPEAIAKLYRLQLAAEAGARAGLSSGAHEASLTLAEAVEAATPRGQGKPHLADTTIPGVSEDGDTATVTTRQIKRITNQGQLTDFPLAKLLEMGRRGGYPVTPGFGRFPGGKKALYWNGLDHPVPIAFPGPMDPNPYATVAATEAMPAITAILQTQLGAGVRGGTK